jgi:hypothetical protein
MTTREMISNVTHGVERTLDRIPVVNIVKRMLDRYTPIKVIFYFFGIHEINHTKSFATL